jgi:hypothetical protein
MSVSFIWELVRNQKALSLSSGSSSDIETLRKVFGDPAEISTREISKLRAMHEATGRSHSLWSAIADKLEQLQGSGAETEICIKVWTEF